MNNDSILPDGYTTPTSAGNYMKLENGDNEFRALSKMIMGWIYWDTAGKPVRINAGPKDKPSVDESLIKADKQGKKDLKFFWALVVYNYKASAIQILELTQVSIQKGIEEFLKSPKWGSYYLYDINLKKKVEGDKTSYQVLTNPPAPISEDIKLAYTQRPANLQIMFTNGDPFATAKTNAANVALEKAPVATPATDEIVNTGPHGSSDLPF